MDELTKRLERIQKLLEILVKCQIAIGMETFKDEALYVSRLEDNLGASANMVFDDAVNEFKELG